MPRKRLDLNAGYYWVEELRAGTFRDGRDAHLNKTEILQLYDEIVTAHKSEDEKDALIASQEKKIAELTKHLNKAQSDLAWVTYT